MAIVIPIPVAIFFLPVAAVVWLWQRKQDSERAARNARLKRENDVRNESDPGRQDW